MKPIRKAGSLRDQVLDHLREALLDGAFDLDERITEEKVANLLGVSRTPVREALALLHQQGILQTREKSGYQIAVPSLKETREVLELRKLLEPHAIREVVKICTPEDITRLRKIVEQETSVSEEENPREFAIQNFRFRSELFGLVGNRRLQRIFTEFNDHIFVLAMLTLEDIKVRKIILKGQRSIVDALAKNDVVAAAKAIKAHLQNAEKAVTKSMLKHS